MTSARISECDPIINRNPPDPIRRMVWQEREDSLNEHRFMARYRMDKISFRYIVNLMKPFFTPKKGARPDTIGADIALSVTLRYLAGGSYLDIIDLHRIRESTFYDIVSKTLCVLEFVLQDEIKFPKTAEDLKRTADGFGAKSGFDLQGCVGALDGLAVNINTPKLCDCDNPAVYRNRKGFPAIVVQAICDSNRLFT